MPRPSPPIPLLALAAALLLAPAAGAALPQQSGEALVPRDAQVRLTGVTGSALAATGDLSGDGIGELLLTSGDTVFGAFGRLAPFDAALGQLGDAQAVRIVVHPSWGKVAFTSGDVDGDGLRDVVVGAPGYDADQGAVFVVRGTGGWGSPIDPETAPPSRVVKIEGATDDEAGAAVATGDVNGDRIADLVIGEPGANGGAGAVHVLFGGTGLGAQTLGGSLAAAGFAITGAAPGDRLGTAVAVGDMTGDGKGEVAAGAPEGGMNSRGTVYLVRGGAQGDVAVGDLVADERGWRFEGEHDGDRAGAALAVSADTTGGPGGDLAIGAPGFDAEADADAGAGAKADAGALFTFEVTPATNSTTRVLLTPRLTGSAAGDRFGAALAAAGDLNSDGVAEVAVGAPDAAGPGGEPGAGLVRVLAGQPLPGQQGEPKQVPGFDVRGQTAGAHAGAALTGGTDLNGDGRDDLVVGATGAGAAFVLYGYGSPQLRYPVSSVTTRNAVDLAPAELRRTGPATFTATPPLPAGLTLDPATGRIAGTAPAGSEGRRTITMSDLAASVSVDLAIVAPPDLARPVISNARFENTRFRIGSKPTPLVVSSAKKKAKKDPVGSALRWTLSEPATVRIRVERGLEGRKVGSRCEEPSKKNRKKKACTRWVAAGTLVRRAPKGAFRMVFTGRIAARGLKSGRYHAKLQATDQAGNRSATTTRSFQVARPLKYR